MNNNKNIGPEGARPPGDGEDVIQDGKNGDAPDKIESAGEANSPDLEKAADAILDAGGDAPENDIEALKAELAEAQDRYIRVHAEMENLRKRTDRELMNRSRYAIAKFAESIVSVGDNMQRAIQAVPENAVKDNPALTGLIDGIKVTERELLNILERFDIKPIDAEGTQLDPNFHQAMFEMPNPDVPAGTILQVIQPGYMIGDRLLRAAQVGVAKGGPKGLRPATTAQSDVAVDAPIEPLDTGINKDPGTGAGSQGNARPSGAANDDAPAPGSEAKDESSSGTDADIKKTGGSSSQNNDPIDI